MCLTPLGQGSTQLAIQPTLPPTGASMTTKSAILTLPLSIEARQFRIRKDSPMPVSSKAVSNNITLGPRHKVAGSSPEFWFAAALRRTEADMRESRNPTQESDFRRLRASSTTNRVVFFQRMLSTFPARRQQPIEYRTFENRTAEITRRCGVWKIFVGWLCYY